MAELPRKQQGAGYEGRLGDYIGVFDFIGGGVSAINVRRGEITSV